MTESNSNAESGEGTDAAPDLVKTRLRGDALNDAAKKSNVDHTDYEATRNPDAELRLDGEDDSLYGDGLDVGDDSESWAGTDGDAPKGFKG
jgi:hypothetical protein